MMSYTSSSKSRSRNEHTQIESDSLGSDNELTTSEDDLKDKTASSSAGVADANSTQEP